MFSNYSCHVTPSNKNLKALKLNDIYRPELAKCMHKLHHGALPKIYDIVFQNNYSIHLYETRCTDNQNYLTQRVSTNSGKKAFLLEGLRSEK